MEQIRKLMDNMGKVIVGKEKVIEKVLVCLLCKGHVLIEDVPGVGKTTMVHSLAKSLDMSFRRIQFTPDLLPSDVTGVSVYNQSLGEFQFKKGPIYSNLVLADEINRTSPKTQSSLLEAMQEGQITVDGITYPLPKPFIVLATQNPIEYEGTFPLPEAQLDRFMMKISIGYPDKLSEKTILRRFKGSNPLESITASLEIEDIYRMQKEVEGIYVDESIDDYIRYIENSITHNKVKRKAIIISGAFPDCEPKHYHTLYKALYNICEVLLMNGYKIVFGAHPTFKQIIFGLRAVSIATEGVNPIKMYVSKYYVTDGLIEDDEQYADMCMQ